jgi:hypothetical protein
MTSLVFGLRVYERHGRFRHPEDAGRGAAYDGPDDEEGLVPGLEVRSQSTALVSPAHRRVLVQSCGVEYVARRAEGEGVARSQLGQAAR